MRHAFLIAMLLLGASHPFAFADEYYRWVDENGTLHLSDTRPSLSLDIEVDATAILMPKNHADSSAPPTPNVPDSPAEPSTPPQASRIQLLSPQNDATIRNNEGDISLEIATNLPLGEKQSLRVVLNGQPQPTQNSLVLNNIDRGTHTIKVQIMQNGKVIASSDQITVFLHRAIQRKAAPKRKPTPL